MRSTLTRPAWMRLRTPRWSVTDASDLEIAPPAAVHRRKQERG